MLEGLDPKSPTWRAVEDWARQQIESAKDALVEKDDDRQRGRIEALRELIDLGADKPRPVIAPRAARPDQV